MFFYENYDVMFYYREETGLMPSFVKWTIISIIWSFFSLFLARCGEKKVSKSFTWPEIRREYKPGVYLHLMGSAAKERDMKQYLAALHQAGIGGALVIPIYGVRGEEKNYLSFLSPQWMNMLDFTTRLADSLDINIDMTTGTGWPFGGSHITPEDAALKIEMKKYALKKGERFHMDIDKGRLVAVEAFGPEKTRVGLEGNIQKNGCLDWLPPGDGWTVYILTRTGTGQMVKRAAPGNEGLVLNPFSVKSMDVYLQRFDSAFAGYTGRMPRSQYHDSYEYYNADWTDGLFETFRKQHGYDLKDYLPELFGTGDPESGMRVKADYRETMEKLHLKYIRRWVAWAHDKGMITRNEGHGAPANWLDLYSAADIPETEIFGSTPFDIPGWKRLPENNSNSVPLNPLILRFSSSAAHVAGKRLVASETLTWLRNHFRSALWQAKPEIDRLFLSGINHIYYHGSAYTPADAPWPGWLFYASVHYQPQNAVWHDLDQLNAYAARCQSILQSGNPDNDILVYWPLQDVWHKYPDLMLKGLNVHDIEWFTSSEFGKIAQSLWKDGYAFDYISRSQCMDISVEGKNLKTKGGTYETIIIPKTDYMPVELWEKITGLARSGATIIVHKALPSDVPGFGQFELRRAKLMALNDELNSVFKKADNHWEASLKEGKILLGEDLEEMLNAAGVGREQMADKGLEFIRRLRESGRDYFISNLTANIFEGWLPLSVSFQSAILMNPLDENQIGLARVRHINGRQEIFLQLMPGASIIVRTFMKLQTGEKKWQYFVCKDEGVVLKGTWKVDFVQGGPDLPEPFQTDKLIPWTSAGDSAAMRFAGTGRYRLEFELDKTLGEEWLLDLGKVCESARVRINGEDAGALWCIPFRKRVGKFLRQGKNVLEVEVTNLSANRLRDLDRRGVDWKKFFFVDVHYKHFDAAKWPVFESGLPGPVRLMPLKKRVFD